MSKPQNLKYFDIIWCPIADYDNQLIQSGMWNELIFFLKKWRFLNFEFGSAFFQSFFLQADPRFIKSRSELFWLFFCCFVKLECVTGWSALSLSQGKSSSFLKDREISKEINQGQNFLLKHQWPLRKDELLPWEKLSFLLFLCFELLANSVFSVPLLWVPGK